MPVMSSIADSSTMRRHHATYQQQLTCFHAATLQTRSALQRHSRLKSIQSFGSSSISRQSCWATSPLNSARRPDDRQPYILHDSPKKLESYHCPNPRDRPPSRHPRGNHSTDKRPKHSTERCIAKTESITSRSKHSKCDIVGSQIYRNPEQCSLQVRNPRQLLQPFTLVHPFKSACLEVILDQVLFEFPEIQLKTSWCRPAIGHVATMADIIILLRFEWLFCRLESRVQLICGPP